MVERPYSGKYRPVRTTDDIWCPFCVEGQRRLYLCDIHHWGSAPYFENRLPKAQSLVAAPAKRKA